MQLAREKPSTKKTHVEVGQSRVAERLVADELHEARAALDGLHGAQREQQIHEREELLGGQRGRGRTREQTLALADDERLHVSRPLVGAQLRHARLHELDGARADHVILLVPAHLRLGQRCERTGVKVQSKSKLGHNVARKTQIKFNLTLKYRVVFG